MHCKLNFSGSHSLFRRAAGARRNVFPTSILPSLEEMSFTNILTEEALNLLKYIYYIYIFIILVLWFLTSNCNVTFGYFREPFYIFNRGSLSPNIDIYVTSSPHIIFRQQSISDRRVARTSHG